MNVPNVHLLPSLDFGSYLMAAVKRVYQKSGTINVDGSGTGVGETCSVEVTLARPAPAAAAALILNLNINADSWAVKGYRLKPGFPQVAELVFVYVGGSDDGEFEVDYILTVLEF